MDSVGGTSGAGYAHEGSEPFDRPAEKVLEAVLDDFCTVEHAREAYGVVVNPHTETVHRHHRNGGGIEVTAELKSNGTPVQHTGTSNGNGSLPLGAQIEIASEAAFLSCAAEMLALASRGWHHATDVWNGRRPAPTCQQGQRARQQGRTDRDDSRDHGSNSVGHRRRRCPASGG